jgi:hypothetical protein
VADGRLVADVEGPGANVAVLPPGLVESRLRELLAGFGETPDACCAGSAGAEVPVARALLEKLLA